MIKKYIFFVIIFSFIAHPKIYSVNVVKVNFTTDSADFVVSKDGSGHFTTIQAAVNAVPDYRRKRTRIFIQNGTYNEKLIVPSSKQMISFIGESVEKTIIAYGDWAQKKNVFGEDIGTSGSSTVFIYGNDFQASNITFQNTAGPVGQAVAAHISSDRSIFNNCRFLGFQDTLYTYSENSRQYYINCFIEGTTDFIFGSSTAVFDQCNIHSLKDSYITAASTGENTRFGYLFYKCRLTAQPEVKKMYLGRPWRNFAKTVFRECELGDFIHPHGWNNWNKTEAEKTIFYGEYKNIGIGANISNRVEWSHQLTDEQAKEWTVENVLAGNDNWNPEVKIYIINNK
jgi:pectinesterase